MFVGRKAPGECRDIIPILPKASKLLQVQHYEAERPQTPLCCGYSRDGKNTPKELTLP